MNREVSVLVYHDISDGASPLTSHLLLSTRPEVFREHIAYFARNYDIIGVDELLSGKLPHRPLLLTFDDAYRSVLTTAAPILKEFDAPSIFFVIAAAVCDHWLAIDNVLSLAAEGIGLAKVLDLMKLPTGAVSSVGAVISRFIARMRPEEITTLKSRLLAALGSSEAAARQMSGIFMESTDLPKLGSYRMEVGNHSMTHSHFRTLSSGELDAEIRQSCCELRRLSGQRVRCLSVPYGDEADATEDTMSVARTSGHQATFLVHARSNRFRRRDNAYYRISLKNQNIREVALALRVLPVLRSFRHALAG